MRAVVVDAANGPGGAVVAGVAHVTGDAVDPLAFTVNIYLPVVGAVVGVGEQQLLGGLAAGGLGVHAGNAGVYFRVYQGSVEVLVLPGDAAVVRNSDQAPHPVTPVA